MPEPILPESFAWVPQPWGRALVCLPLAAHAHHLFTTREPALPGAPADGGVGWGALAHALGVGPDRLAQLRQVHGARMVHVPGESAGSGPDGTWGEGDGLATALPSVALAVKAADCVPVLLADRRSGAVAAVHAGWRGTAAAIAVAAVQTMAARFGSAPADLVAAVGPSIGPCCYQVGTDVQDRFIEEGAGANDLSDWFSLVPVPPGQPGLGLGAAARGAGSAVQPGKLWLDTWRANADLLAQAGVPPAQIHVSGLCTACYPSILHSYRVDGARAGRMAGAIRSRHASG
jgi:hypothetical protein